MNDRKFNRANIIDGSDDHYQKLYKSQNLMKINKIKKSYYDEISIFKDVTRLSKLSRYDLKCLNVKEGSPLVFVCSCISSKLVPDNHYNLINFKNETQSYGNSDDSQISKARNLDFFPCKFRLRFIFDKISKKFQLSKNSKIFHNHPPKAKLSKEAHLTNFRSIKFSFKEICLILRNLIFEFTQHKIISTEFISKFCQTIYNLKKRNVGKKTFNKKLKNFIKPIYIDLIKNFISESENLPKVMISLMKIVVIKGNNYMVPLELHYSKKFLNLKFESILEIEG